jgi:hypothetical protein
MRMIDDDFGEIPTAPDEVDTANDVGQIFLLRVAELRVLIIPRKWQPDCLYRRVISLIDTKENSLRALWDRVTFEWCRTFHSGPYWPVHGNYRCRICLRSYPVPWREGDAFARRELASTDLNNRRRRFVEPAFQKDRG